MNKEINSTIIIKKFSIWRFLKRLILGFICFIILFSSLSILLVYAYEDDVKNLVIKELNKHLNSKISVEPQNINLTIIKSFPKCAIEFKNVLALESNDFETHDTLLFAKRLSLAFNIKDIFNANYNIKKIEIEESKINLKIDKMGKENYLIWKSSGNSKSNDSLKFELEKISLLNVVFNYKNLKQKIKINTLLNSVAFSGKFNEKNYILTTKGSADIELFQIQKVKYINNKKLNFDVELAVNQNKYKIIKADTKINSTLLNSNGSFVINDSLVELDLFFTGKNLDISSSLSLLPQSFKNRINDYESEGVFYANGECHFKAGKGISLKSNFGIKQATIIYKPNNAKVTSVNLEGIISINENKSSLTLTTINANLGSNTFVGNLELNNFNNPFLKLNILANTNLEELILFYPIDTLQSLKGNVKVNAKIEGLISELKSNTFSPTIIANGNAELLNIKAQIKGSEKEINIPEANVKLVNRNLEINSLKIIKGNSDISLVGDMPNFLGYLFDQKSKLVVNATIKSDFVDLDDFLYSTKANSKSSSVFIPPNLELSTVVVIKKLSFKKFTATQLSGKLAVKNQKVAVNDLSFLAMEGNLSMNAFADASGNNIKISGDCNLSKINVKQLFYQLNNFGQNTIQDKHLKGFATANIDFIGTWDKELNIDLNTLNATSSLLIEQGELIGFKPLESLAKYIDVNELKHIKFSSLLSAVEIKNKIITLPKTIIKSSAINMELWGKHTFDNNIDYHIQLLISDLLAKKPRANKNFDEELSLIENDPENRRSVFILMTGPIDNPTIKYDKQGAKIKIKEDIKQEKQNIKQLLKEEFGLFKKDSTSSNKNENNKANQKFQIKINNDNSKKENPVKSKNDDDDF